LFIHHIFFENFADFSEGWAESAMLAVCNSGKASTNDEQHAEAIFACVSNATCHFGIQARQVGGSSAHGNSF
jgi:hypothetical protein